MPYACGSFASLRGDILILAGDCANNVGKWGHDGVRELYECAAFTPGSHHWATHPLFHPECDDYNFVGSLTLSPGDVLKIYVH